MDVSTDHPYKWWIFISLALSVMLVNVDLSAVNLAIPSITDDLNLTLNAAQWIINGYTIAAAALMAYAGRLCDMFGYRKIFLPGLLVFILTSIAVAFSMGAWSISLSRIFQGASIAFIFPIAGVIVRDVFPQNEQGFAIGLIVSIAGFSQALGPTFGGILISLLS